MAERSGWWVLGFTFDDVLERWEDALLATAIERIRATGGYTADVVVAWTATDDVRPVHFYLSAEAGVRLDRAGVNWRRFLIHSVECLPSDAQLLDPLVRAGASAGPGAPQPDSLLAYHVGDHGRLALQVAELQHPIGAARCLADLERAMALHFSREEETFFPLYEKQAAAQRGVTGVLSREHAEIRRILASMREALEQAELTAYRQRYQLLTMRLPGHYEREQRIIFPALDQALSPAGRASLIHRLVTSESSASGVE